MVKLELLSVLSNESHQADWELFFFSEKPGNENFHRAAAMREKIKTINFHYYLHTIYIKMHVFFS